MSAVGGLVSPRDPLDERGVWTVRWWRFLPPLIVLITVIIIVATSSGQLLANHWAYPVTLLIAGIISLSMVVVARPRRVPKPVPYPHPDVAGGR